MPDSTASPPTSTAAAGSELDRLQSEVGDLLKEARLTQAAIQQLQASASTTRTVDVLPLDLGDPGFDAPLAFAGIGLVLTLVAGTWWLWRKNLIHRSIAEEELDSEPMISAPAHPQKAQDHPPAQTPAPVRAAEPSTSFDSFDSGFMDSAFYTPDSPGETSQTPIEAPGAFDSEAAASEVMRVRNSLAEKRRARAMLLLQEEATRTLQARERHEEVTEEQRHHLDIDLNLLALVPLPETQAPEPEPMPMFKPEPEPLPVPVPMPEPEPLPELAFEPDFAPVQIPVAMPGVEQPELFSSPVETTDECPPETPSASAEDDAIKLELAQEAVLLDLLPQARELALEVLEGGDTRLASEVEALISRIDQIESESKQAQLQWNEAP